MIPRTALHPEAGAKESGLKGEYFDNPTFSGRPGSTRNDKQIDFDWDGASPGPNVPETGYSVRWTGFFAAPAPGKYRSHCGEAGCYRCGDQEIVLRLGWTAKSLRQHAAAPPAIGAAEPEPAAEVRFSDTHEHAIRVDYVFKARTSRRGPSAGMAGAGGRVARRSGPCGENADMVLAFVGISPNLEGEEMPVHVDGFAGGDRTDIDLPKAQQDLLDAVAATGKPVVVVLMSGSAMAMNWAKDHAAALLEAWYPGEAGGEAIADILTGKANPSGRLPDHLLCVRRPASAFTDYSMKNRTYRYFDGQPLYNFGYGLSYTTFRYSASSYRPRRSRQASRSLRK